jgi:hypothetical protein
MPFFYASELSCFLKSIHFVSGPKKYLLHEGKFQPWSSLETVCLSLGACNLKELKWDHSYKRESN